MGDGESAEGSIWEAIHFAGYYKLDNLCAIFDVNRLGQSEPTSLGHQMDIYQKRLEAFGWNAIVVDGHNIEELVKAFHVAANTKDKPTALVAKTFKGKNFPNIEDLENWHGKPLGAASEKVLQVNQSLNDVRTRCFMVICVVASERSYQEPRSTAAAPTEACS